MNVPGMKRQTGHSTRLNEDARMNLKSMSLDQLVNLQDQVNSTLSAKVADQRRTLESELSKISRFQVGGARTKSGRGGVKGSSVAPKYRNPENASETWAGRGLKPRWLTTAIKSGKKQEDFLIAGASSSAKANGRKKARKARK
jgi:DNA-binding protein H-NS